jgi:hypothetical protein
MHVRLIYVKWAESAPIYVAKGFILVRRFYAYTYIIHAVRDMLIKLYHSTKCVQTAWKTTEVEYSIQQFITLMPAPLPALSQYIHAWIYRILACFRVKNNKMMSSVAKVMLLSSDCDTGIRLSVESVQGIWLDTRHKFNVNLVFAYKRMKSVKNVFPTMSTSPRYLVRYWNLLNWTRYPLSL